MATKPAQTIPDKISIDRFGEVRGQPRMVGLFGIESGWGGLWALSKTSKELCLALTHMLVFEQF